MLILLVEDDIRVRSETAGALKAGGHDVVEVATGDEAIEAIRYQSCTFSDLVTEYDIPGVATGPRVAAVMREKTPTAPVIIAAGQTEVFRRHWAKQFGYRILRKPYTPQNLVYVVNTLLRQAA